MNCTQMQTVLHADLDGELDAARSVELAEHVSSCPDCARLQTELIAQRQMLRAGLDYHRAPASLRSALTPAPGRWPIPVSFAAGALAAGLALALLPRTAPDADELIAGHLRALQPGHLLDVASTDQHNVKPWFDGRLDYAPPVEDLAQAGFPLAGGRLDVIAGRPVAALVYRRLQHVIDLFVWPADRIVPAARPGQGYNVVAWAQDGFTFRAVSDLNGTELQAFAKAWQSRP